jgi:hypothetical protein
MMIRHIYIFPIDLGMAQLLAKAPKFFSRPNFARGAPTFVLRDKELSCNSTLNCSP